jgi:hypothetical protein
MEENGAVQDSVVIGDVHTGDVHHNTNVTNVDNSTQIEFPSLDEVAKQASNAAIAAGEASKTMFVGLSNFLKGTINKVLLLAGLVVIIVGILIYTGDVDANNWIDRIF